MHSLLQYTPLILIFVTTFLFIISLIAFSMVLYVIQRRHPIYYKKIGQPYTWFTSTDISFRSGGLRRLRAKAWFHFLGSLFRTVPDLIYRDKTGRFLSNIYRRASRVLLITFVFSIFAVLPQATMMFHGYIQTTKPVPVVDHKRTQLIITATGNEHVSSSDASTKQNTSVTRSSVTSTQTTVVVPGGIGSNDPVAVPSKPSPAVPQQVSTHLNRADINSVLLSVGRPGIARSQKQAVCQSIVGQEPAASDVGPAGAICTDSNLLSYSNY
jgi:hypothetical protein